MATHNNNSDKYLYGDPLNRRTWSKEGAVAAGKTSFWKKFSGNSFHKAIYQRQGLNTGHKGNDVMFEFDGFLAQEPLHGDAQISGTGENRKKFSARMYTKNFHNSVAIAPHWDLALIDSVALGNFNKQRTDMFSERGRIMDQSKFDCAMGFFEDDTPSHIILPGNKTDIESLTSADKPSVALLDKIAHACITGEGCLQLDETSNSMFNAGAYSINSARPGLRQWASSDEQGEEVMTIDLCVDWYFIQALDQDPAWRQLQQINVRGNGNPLLSATIYEYKNIRLHRMPLFQGATSARALNRSAVEAAGMRRYDNVNKKWTGEKGFDNAYANNKFLGSAFVIGAGGMISHSSLAPIDEFTIEMNNHKQRKEAAIHYWMNIKRTRLFEHNGDYEMRKMAGYDLGLINVFYGL